jgi:hypothetical protein
MKKTILRPTRNINAKKMTDDLQKAMALVGAWASDPAEVFKEYGLVKDVSEVEVGMAKVDFGMPTFGRLGGVGSLGGMGPDIVAAKVCGCACAAVIEAELEVEW